MANYSISTVDDFNYQAQHQHSDSFSFKPNVVLDLKNNPFDHSFEIKDTLTINGNNCILKNGYFPVDFILIVKGTFRHFTLKNIIFDNCTFEQNIYNSNYDRITISLDNLVFVNCTFKNSLVRTKSNINNDGQINITNIKVFNSIIQKSTNSFLLYITTHTNDSARYQLTFNNITIKYCYSNSQQPLLFNDLQTHNIVNIKLQNIDILNNIIFNKITSLTTSYRILFTQIARNKNDGSISFTNVKFNENVFILDNNNTTDIHNLILDGSIHNISSVTGTIEVHDNYFYVNNLNNIFMNQTKHNYKNNFIYHKNTNIMGTVGFISKTTTDTAYKSFNLDLHSKFDYLTQIPTYIFINNNTIENFGQMYALGLNTNSFTIDTSKVTPDDFINIFRTIKLYITENIYQQRFTLDDHSQKINIQGIYNFKNKDSKIITGTFNNKLLFTPTHQQDPDIPNQPTKTTTIPFIPSPDEPTPNEPTPNEPTPDEPTPDEPDLSTTTSISQPKIKKGIPTWVYILIGVVLIAAIILGLFVF